MSHIKEYLALKKVKKIKIWSKDKTYDHESDIDSYYIRIYKNKKNLLKFKSFKYKKKLL